MNLYFLSNRAPSSKESFRQLNVEENCILTGMTHSGFRQLNLWDFHSLDERNAEQNTAGQRSIKGNSVYSFPLQTNISDKKVNHAKIILF